MDKNVGGFDRTWRTVVGPLLIVVGLAVFAGLFSLGSGTLMALVVPVLLIVFGAVFTWTAQTQQCPVNQAIGRNTFRDK